jgi:hypothetical protein
MKYERSYFITRREMAGFDAELCAYLGYMLSGSEIRGCVSLAVDLVEGTICCAVEVAGSGKLE